MSQTASSYYSYQAFDRENYRPTGRLYVHSTVYLPGSDMDFETGMLRRDTQRRGRTQALRMEARRLDREYARMDAALHARKGEKGKRMQLRHAVLLVMSVVLFFSLVLLVQQGVLSRKTRSYQLTRQANMDISEQNKELQAQIDEASDSATICYAASQDLGMIPASSTQAIHLTAVDTRPSENVNSISVSAAAQASVTGNADTQ